jgi:LAO/AO transport system kinase
VNKADGEQREAARRARISYQHALSLLRPTSAHWRPPVLLASALSGAGIEEFWEQVVAHRLALQSAGELEARRSEQAKAWLWSLVGEALHRSFRTHPAVAGAIPRIEAEVSARKTTPGAAARALLDAFRDR